VGTAMGAGAGLMLYEGGSTIASMFSGTTTVVGSSVSPGAFAGTLAKSAVGGSMVGVGALTMATNNTIYNALLAPETLDLSQVVSITKTAQPLSSENPETVSYTIRIAPTTEDTIVTIRGAVDSLSYNCNQEARDQSSLGACPTSTPASPEFDAFKQDLAGLVGQTLPADGVEFSYSIPFGSEYNHAKIINTLNLTFDATVQSEIGTQQLTNQTQSGTASVCFGECPQAEGCFLFVDTPPAGAQARITGASTGTSAKTWTEDEKNRVGLAFSKRAGTSDRFTNLACSQGDITLYRLSGTAYGGWAMSNSEVGLYDLAFQGDNGLEYTLVHELGHIIDHRNGGLRSGLIGGCAPTYPATCNAGEPFAEAVALYVVHSTYTFSRGIGQYDFPNELPTQYEYIRDNIFNDSPPTEFRN
jgi:hypothetical protein